MEGMAQRPKERPSTELSYDDLQKIERLVWAEARGEGVEGRNAVRGVILNRLASSRFPDSLDEILSADQFEPIKTYGSVSAIPIPKEDLDLQIAEMADYIHLGEDAVDGRTFFQNTETTKARGTGFSGPDPVQIGNHTFTRGYEGQEPVLDTHFSHNIKLVEPNIQLADASYALGGLVEAQKGILTEEGLDMANKKFQMDDKKADKDGDGKLSAYEKMAGEAVQKADADAPDQDEKYGMCMGGMMMPEEEIDPVSGNPIPLGSTAANVRDDIEIYVSEGEYVLPADVVKWHGLKHIMEMQDEAKMGLMGMYAEGLIQEVMTEAEEDDEAPEGTEEDMVEDIAEGEELDDDDVPSEEMDVEVAAVEVDDMMDEEEDPEEVYPEESVLPAMMKKQKFAFIV